MLPIAARRTATLSQEIMNRGDAPDFVEVGEEDVAESDATRHRRYVQFVG